MEGLDPSRITSCCPHRTGLGRNPKPAVSEGVSQWMRVAFASPHTVKGGFDFMTCLGLESKIAGRVPLLLDVANDRKGEAW